MPVSMGQGKGGELQQKPALSSKKPIKGKPSKAENFLIITVLFLSNTTGKQYGLTPTMLAKAKLGA